MLFHSFEFIFGFLPIAVAGFYVLAHRAGRAPAVFFLMVASLFFYAWWNPVYFFLIVFSLLFNFAIGREIGRRRRDGRATRAVLWLGLAVDIGLLGYFKYANFFVAAAADATGMRFVWDAVILPLGISFFTFQQIAYLVDVHEGRAAEYGFARYALFVLFFPQLIAGPIVHHHEILPQFDRDAVYRFDAANLAPGLTMFAIGMFKKVVIADALAWYADPVYAGAAAGGAVTLVEAWLAAFAFTFQLYFDFSGYTDMAVGLARIFGVRLPMNFNSPYKSVSFIDFWRRMHVTLSRFLRDYIYVRLGGAQYGFPRQAAALVITMAIAGFWHGAGWTYLLFGVVMGVYLAVNHGWRLVTGSTPERRNAIGPARRALCCVSFFLFFAVSLVMFRSESLAATWLIWKAMAGLNGITLYHNYYEAIRPILPLLASLGLEVQADRMLYWRSIDGVYLVATLFLVSWFAPNSQEIVARAAPLLDFRADTNRPLFRVPWAPTLGWGIVTGVVLFVAGQTVFAVPRAEFIYFQF